MHRNDALFESLTRLVWTAAAGESFEAIASGGGPGVIPEEDRERIARSWEQATAASDIFSVEYRLIGADGGYRWFLSRGIPFRDADGDTKWVGTTTDIDDQKRAAEMMRYLAEAGKILVGTLDLERALRDFTGLIVPGLADWCTINVREGDRFRLLARAAADTQTADALDELLRRYPWQLGSDAPGPRAYATGRTIYVSAVDSVRREAYAVDDEHRRLLRRLPMTAFVSVPLADHEEPIGYINVACGKGRSLSSVDAGLIEELARRVSLAAVNARLFAEQRRSTQRLRYLAEAGRILSQSLELGRMLDGLVRLFLPEVADWSSIHLVEDDGRICTAAIASADPVVDRRIDDFRNAYVLNPAAQIGTPHVLRTGRAQLDAAGFDQILPGVAWPLEMRFSSSIIVPIVIRGRTIGTLVAACNDRRNAFNEETVLFFGEIAQRAASAINNAQAYERERRVADALQQASLPTSLPDVVGVRFSGVYQPGGREAQIGGDWYDALRLSDGCVVLSIGDVAGSGLAAAVIMSSVRQVVRGIAQVHADPNLMLDAADKALRAEYPDRIVTAFVGVFDPVTLTLTYASAGHPAPYLRAPGGVIEELAHRGLPLGLRRADEPRAQNVQIEPGSLLLLYTDGLLESTRDLDEGERRIRAALASEEVRASRDVAQAVHDRVLFDGSHDDVAILAVEITPVVAGSHNGGIEHPVRRWIFDIGDASAAQQARTEFIEFLRSGGNIEDDYFGAEIVFGELVGNVLRYAPGSVEVMLDWTGSAPVLHVLDDGPGFQHVPALPSDILSERGRGLFIVATLTEDFHVARRPGAGSHARAVLPLRHRRPAGVHPAALSGV